MQSGLKSTLASIGGFLIFLVARPRRPPPQPTGSS